MHLWSEAEAMKLVLPVCSYQKMSPQKGRKQKQETEIETKNFHKVPQNWPKQPPPCFCFSKMFQKQKQKNILKQKILFLVFLKNLFFVSGKFHRNRNRNRNSFQRGGWHFEKIVEQILFLLVSVSNSYEVRCHCHGTKG